MLRQVCLHLTTVLAVWLGVMYAITHFIKWSQKTKMLTMFGGPISIIVSMLVKSVSSSSNGAVTMMGHNGALAQVPSWWIHYSQLLIAFCIWVTIPVDQNWSWRKDNVWCWHWCSVSEWHLFMAATQWPLGTINCKTSSNSPAGVWWW